MTRKFGMILAAAASTTFIAGSAIAETPAPLTAIAQGDFALHAGASAASKTTATVASGSTVLVDGCLPDGMTCKVSVDGTPGWAPADHLGVMVDGQMTLLANNPQTVTIKQIKVPTDTANKDRQASAAVAGAAAGGVAGAAIGGPVGALVGILVGADTVGKAAKPEPATVTWVEKHPLAPVYLQGELKPGVIVPDVVTLTPVPNSEYAYVNINDETVFVKPEDRTVVYVVPAS